jgi:hypothetical protein
VTYINRVGHVSVPEDLWADMLVLLDEFQSEIECSGVNMAILQRARRLDALHRTAQYEAGRSTREQIERGGSNRPYED